MCIPKHVKQTMISSDNKIEHVLQNNESDIFIMLELKILQK